MPRPPICLGDCVSTYVRAYPDVSLVPHKEAEITKVLSDPANYAARLSDILTLLEMRKEGRIPMWYDTPFGRFYNGEAVRVKGNYDCDDKTGTLIGLSDYGRRALVSIVGYPDSAVMWSDLERVQDKKAAVTQGLDLGKTSDSTIIATITQAQVQERCGFILNQRVGINEYSRKLYAFDDAVILSLGDCDAGLRVTIGKETFNINVPYSSLRKL